MLGREVNTPASLMFPQVQENTAEPEGYVQKLATNIGKAHSMARKKLATSTQRMKRDYDLRILERPYQVGDAIYVLDTAVLKGKCRKLVAPWKGPGVIVTKLSSALFRVKVRNAVFVVNHDRIKPCRDRSIPRWIQHWKANPDTSGGDGSTDKVYCFCRGPWQGRFMIQCESCDEWYHGACVNVSPTEALDIDQYECEECAGKANRR